MITPEFFCTLRSFIGFLRFTKLWLADAEAPSAQGCTVWPSVFRYRGLLACIWHIGKLAERLSNNIESNAYNAAYAAKLDAEASFRLDALEHFAPNMQATAELRAAFALWAGRTREWLATQYKIFEIQENRARLADAGNQNIRILEPHFHILIGIGSTVHLDAYIKAGILGLRPPSRTVVLHEPWLRRYAVNPCMLDYWRKFIDIVEDPAELQSLRPMRKSLAFNVTGPIQCGAKIIPWGHSALCMCKSGGTAKCGTHYCALRSNIVGVEWKR